MHTNCPFDDPEFAMKFRQLVEWQHDYMKKVREFDDLQIRMLEIFAPVLRQIERTGLLDMLEPFVKAYAGALPELVAFARKKAEKTNPHKFW